MSSRVVWSHGGVIHSLAHSLTQTEEMMQYDAMRLCSILYTGLVFASICPHSAGDISTTDTCMYMSCTARQYNAMQEV